MAISVQTAPNGLSFPTVLANKCLDCHGVWDCDLNQQIDTRNANTLQACTDLCSISHPRCWGISFNTATNSCYLKGYPLTNLTSSTSYTSVLANTTQLISLTDTQTCRFPIENQCRIVCDTQYGTAGNYQPTNLAPGFHAETYQQCSAYCSEARPLCKGFTWNPEQDYGYANCYLKNESLSTLSAQSWGGLQSCDVLPWTYALITVAKNITGWTFSNRSASIDQSYASVYANGMQACVYACNPPCVAVNLDLSYASGYQNCYLFNDTAELSTTTDYDWVLAMQDSSSSLNNTGNTTAIYYSTSSNPPAWIAAPIVSGVILIVLVVGLVLWLKHRRGARNEPVTGSPAAPPMSEKTTKTIAHSFYAPEMRN